MSNLLINDVDNVLVALPSGKFTKKQEWVPLKAQGNHSCVLYALRRMSLFNQSLHENYRVYEQLKFALNLALPRHPDSASPDEVNKGYQSLLNVAEEICKEWGFEIPQSLCHQPYFREYYERFCNQYRTLCPDINEQKFWSWLGISRKWCFLYELILREILFPLFNVQDSYWHPSQGFKGLLSSLRTYGAHLFLGRFGCGFYDHMMRYAKEDLTQRQVYCFEKGSYQGQNYPGWHAIIVDQAKKVDHKEMIFFRDPENTSIPGKPEKIYMLSYATFLQQLNNFQGNRYVQNECPMTKHFGLIHFPTENELQTKTPMTHPR